MSSNRSESENDKTQEYFDSDEEDRKQDDNWDSDDDETATQASKRESRDDSLPLERDEASDEESPKSQQSGARSQSDREESSDDDEDSPKSQEEQISQSSKHSTKSPRSTHSQKSSRKSPQKTPPPAIVVSSPSQKASPSQQEDVSKMTDDDRIRYLLTSDDPEEEVDLEPTTDLQSPTSTYRNPYELDAHSNSLVSIDWRNDQDNTKRDTSTNSARKTSSVSANDSSALKKSDRAPAPAKDPAEPPQLNLIHNNERIIYFTQSLIPDTSSDSIFIDFIARLLTLKSPFTIHSQIWVTTHRIVLRRFHARDGDGMVETQDEEDVAEHRSDELLSRVAAITVRKESSPRTILSTPMRGWSQRSAVQRLLGQVGVAVQTLIVYGPVVTSIFLALLMLIWMITFYISNSVLWRLFIGLGLGLLMAQKLVSAVAGVVLSIAWYRWWSQQKELQRFRRGMEEKNAEGNVAKDNLVPKESTTQESSSTPQPGASSATLKAKRSIQPRDPSLPTPIAKKKIVLFTIFGILSTLASALVLIFTSIGVLPLLVIGFLIHVFVTVLHILNLFIMMPTYRHSYPAMVKIHYGDVSSNREDFFSLSSSEEQKTRFVMYQVLGFLAGCGLGVVFSCISYLRHRPSNYKSLKELPQSQNHNQVFFLQYSEAVKLRDIITSLREDIKNYPENVDEGIVYEQLSPMRRNAGRVQMRPGNMQRNSFTSSSVTLKGPHMTRQHIEAAPVERSTKLNESLFSQRKYVLQDENLASTVQDDEEEEEFATPGRQYSPVASPARPSPMERHPSMISENSVISQEYEFQPSPEQSPAYLPPHEISRKLEQYDSDEDQGSRGSWDLSEGK